MKILIPILIGLLVVGCGEGNQIDKKSPKATASNNSSAESVKVLIAEEKKIFGEFEYKNRDGSIIRYILLENGALEIQVGRDTLNMSEKETDEKWKMTNGEIHFVDNYNRYIDVFRVNKDKSITDIGYISDGERADYPKNKQRVFQRVKDAKPTSEIKEPEANTVKALKPEVVVGSYEAGLGGITFRFVLLESGVVKNYFNGIKEPEDAKWKIQGAEVHIEKGKSDGTVIVNKIEPNGDLTVFARIRNGKREDFQNRTYKKIKDRSEAPKTFSEIDTLLRNRKGKSKSDFETVKRYLSSGVDVNRRNKYGGIILHIAAVQGDKRLVSLLLSKGAKVNAKNNIGKTPLDLAIDLKRTETIALLRKYGANTSAGLKAEGKAVKELTLEEKIIGTYELKIDNDTTRLVFQKNDVVEAYSIERQVKKLRADGKWKVVDGKIHVEESEEGKSWVKVYRINKGGSITYISYIMGGERRDWPKEHQDTWRKIK